MPAASAPSFEVPDLTSHEEAVHCEQWLLRGLVQGVGFRPFVWQLARRLGIQGQIRNTGEGVEILAQGQPARLAAFERALHEERPPLAEFELTARQSLPADPALGDFRIGSSQESGHGATIPPDIATCPECLRELFTPADRRHRYPFINCTHCGPRYTITRQLPYDRAQTSMAAFGLCPLCQHEYLDPSSRRFHAEPIACPVCGPQLRLTDRFAVPLKGDPVTGTLQFLRMGRCVAIKGLGGFHLACNARSAEAVARLRMLKHRPSRPLAVMALNLASVEAFCHVSPEEAALLQSPKRPIVLLQKRAEADQYLPGIAPGMNTVGVMLPYTPIHWLMFHESLRRPAGLDWMEAPCADVWVMTSANLSGEPIVTDNDDARHRLNTVADAFLIHNRQVAARCDDSLMMMIDHEPHLLRRARGFAPAPLALRHDGATVLAVGGPDKNTVTLLRGTQALVSPHIGGLDHPLTCETHNSAIRHLERWANAEPGCIACDLDPDNHASQHAEQLAGLRQLPLLRIQRHHALVSAVLAEHDVDVPVLGLVMDGGGTGADGNEWGGELLRVHGVSMERLAHLPHIPLPGGERASREPWRVAAGWLIRNGLGDEAARRYGREPSFVELSEQVTHRLRCPDSSSSSRWFDAIASLAGLCSRQSFSSEARLRLEALARPVAPLAGGWRLDDNGQLDWSPVMHHLLTLTDAEEIASLWHASCAAAVAEWVIRHARQQQIDHVVLAGSSCSNRVLQQALHRHLLQAGLTLLESRQLPSGAGALSLGQACVARQWLAGRASGTVPAIGVTG
ncbi:carbamoyltransferase HypF [Laribacter hongkongensis]|uniref:carbamoyltransferase HypF n=1 Tax=Laribacter hongkongensis TaxID=168471 RepID=UPI001EFE659C|nr:carbamoyltransferase HypF [Laribacter hongkongensis]MCG9107840.1 carbamoyltransferase HypF [Laribacter hongkongensis]